MIQVYTELLYEFVQQHKNNSSLPLDQAHSMKSFLVMAAAHSHRHDWYFSCQDSAKVDASYCEMILTRSCLLEASKKIFYHQVA